MMGSSWTPEQYTNPDPFYILNGRADCPEDRFYEKEPKENLTGLQSLETDQDSSWTGDEDGDQSRLAF